MGYAIGHNVGLNTVSGGAIRYRAYSPLGLTAKQIATVISFGTLTFVLGAAVLLGLSFLSHAGLAGTLLHVPPAGVILAGCLLLGGVRSCPWLAVFRAGAVRYQKLVMPVPGGPCGTAQIDV